MSGSSSLASLALGAHLVSARQLEAREKRGRLPTGIAPLDEILGGGWPRGALSELCGTRGAGRTSLLLASLAATLARHETSALVDAGGSLDPWAALRAGVPLERLLWVRSPMAKALAAAELVLEAGGFGLVVVDLGEDPPRAPTAAWARLKRAAERQGTALLSASTARAPGALGGCAVTLGTPRARFDRGADARAPALLAGIEAAPALARSAFGRSSTSPGGDVRVLLRHRLGEPSAP